jgi:hypothetical protein
MHTHIVRTLDLRAALRAEDCESLTAYDLEDDIARSPEVDAARYASALSGVPADGIPAGRYLFLQMQGAPTDDAVAEEALEVQREGLWRGLVLDSRLYLRVLAEERGVVRQLIRGIKAAENA